MKKNVEEVLHKKYHKKLEKLNAYKEKLKRMQMTFREYGVGCVIKDEWSYYQIEIIYESILCKDKDTAAMAAKTHIDNQKKAIIRQIRLENQKNPPVT